MNRLIISVVFVCSAVLISQSEVRAEGNDALCSVYEISASSDGSGIDKRLKLFSKKFKKEPFAAWKSFTLVKKHERKLVRMKAVTIKLVSGRKLSILYRDYYAPVVSSKKQTKPRLRLSLSLDEKDGKRIVDTTIKLDSGDLNFTASSSEGGKASILATSCTVK